MNAQATDWPDTSGTEPPADHLYRSATWLLGRHPRLAGLACRIANVIVVEDGAPSIDLDHLADVIVAAPAYDSAWQMYERAHHSPETEDAWERWRATGPKPENFAIGLSDFLVMSSGEVASLRLLAAFASERIPFKVSDLRSMDEEGLHLLADWALATQIAYGAHPVLCARRSHRTEPSIPQGPVRPEVHR